MSTDLNIKQSQQAQSLLKALPMTIKVKNSKKKLLVFILYRKKFRSPQQVVLLIYLFVCLLKALSF